jgi:beta-lactamase class D
LREEQVPEVGRVEAPSEDTDFLRRLAHSRGPNSATMRRETSSMLPVEWMRW